MIGQRLRSLNLSKNNRDCATRISSAANVPFAAVQNVVVSLTADTKLLKREKNINKKLSLLLHNPPIFLASEDATNGSVIEKQLRIFPSSKGSSHFFFCSSDPNKWSTLENHKERFNFKNKRTWVWITSIFPVSGAEQLKTSGAQ